MPTGIFARLKPFGRWVFIVITATVVASCQSNRPAPDPVFSVADIREARAYWLAEDSIAWDVQKGSRVSLHYSEAADLPLTPSEQAADHVIELQRDGVVSGVLAADFPHLSGLPLFRLGKKDLAVVPTMLKSQYAAVALDSSDHLVEVTALQPAGVLDELFTYDGDLGVTFTGDLPEFRLWAPTARSVKLHLFDDSSPDSLPAAELPMTEDPSTGTWSLQGQPDWNRKFYLYEVEVYVRRSGQFEHNLVTDPYSLGLAMDSRRSQIVNLADEDLQPSAWSRLEKPPLDKPEDIVLYELHVRDFSIADPTVPEPERGTFAAFGYDGTLGMRHLMGLADAGLSHIHLLPVFDCATIPENPAKQLQPPDLTAFAPDSDRQQLEVDKVRANDAFNWCYDPYHYTVPEGSYSTDPDGTQRILEFREMVSSLNQSGLRVVMDVVYNHTTTAGQADKSVLDKIVPDYYQRLDAIGDVEMSTCCANTATENAMMEKLMVDSLLTWATQYKVDAFRFDLMGHHSKANILKAQEALHALTFERDGVDGKSIYLYGEGWNFGEVANDKRFVQATQAHMGSGTGVGTFNDRIRDAARGGAHDDEGIKHARTQGFINGLYYDPNSENSGSADERAQLLHFADLIRASLAGNLSDFRFIDRNGRMLYASDLDYEGQRAGYASDPQESIHYIAAHDNETLFDINQYKLPVDTPMSDRVRVVNLANSIVALAQGIPFFHAGQDMLRSKSFDSNSFDSGDWFNLLDFSYETNGWARGLPPAWDNEANWPYAGPLLADPDMLPGSLDIRAANIHLKEMLQIRKSSELFRLETADEVIQQVSFHNTGLDQVPGLIVMQLRGDDEVVMVLFNVTTQAQTFHLEGASGFKLHPVQQVSIDPVVRGASFDQAIAAFNVPERTVAVFTGPLETDD
jgi:pullulanase-type alpha-1,6-glucosidase